MAKQWIWVGSASIACVFACSGGPAGGGWFGGRVGGGESSGGSGSGGGQTGCLSNCSGSFTCQGVAVTLSDSGGNCDGVIMANGGINCTIASDCSVSCSDGASGTVSGNSDGSFNASGSLLGQSGSVTCTPNGSTSSGSGSGGVSSSSGSGSGSGSGGSYVSGVTPTNSGPMAGTVSGCGNGPGLCTCSDPNMSGYQYCGFCSSLNMCNYCPGGDYCPADPCQTGNVCSVTGKTCPSGYNACTTALCCPSGYPVCCSNGVSCATTASACP
jgi:hypothetical protein